MGKEGGPTEVRPAMIRHSCKRKKILRKREHRLRSVPRKAHDRPPKIEKRKRKDMTREVQEDCRRRENEKRDSIKKKGGSEPRRDSPCCAIDRKDKHCGHWMNEKADCPAYIVREGDRTGDGLMLGTPLEKKRAEVSVRDLNAREQIRGIRTKSMGVGLDASIKEEGDYCGGIQRGN